MVWSGGGTSSMSRATIRRAPRAITICSARSFRRFLKNWPLTTTIGDLQIDSDDLAHWTVDAAGPNWQVSTRYDFLRQEQMIRANMAEPMWRQVPRALGWALNYLFTGTLFRIYRASPQYGLALTSFPDDADVVARCVRIGRMADRHGWRCGSSTGRCAFGLGRRRSRRRLACSGCCVRWPTSFFVVQINSHWPYLLEYARGERRRAGIAASRPARGGWSRSRAPTRPTRSSWSATRGGGVTAPAVVARALELDPDLGPPRPAHRAADARLADARHRPASRRRAGSPRHRAHRGRAVDSVDRRAGAGGHAEFLQFRSGRRHRHRRRPATLQSAGLDRAAARHAGAGVLQEADAGAGFACTTSSSWRTTCARPTNT